MLPPRAKGEDDDLEWHEYAKRRAGAIWLGEALNALRDSATQKE